MKTRTPKALLSSLVGAALLLAACGGGDDRPPSPTQDVPSSASATTDGFVAYLKALVAAATDMLEPADTGAVTPPTDDTIEPAPVD